MFVTPLLLTLCLNLAPSPAPAPGELPAPPHATSAAPTRAPDRPFTVSLRLENDIVEGTDQNYSNGISLTFSQDGRGPLGGLWEWLGAGDGRSISSYELGQLIITPLDITREVPDPADRPYAGLLYAALSTQHVRGRRLDALKVVAGVVGPASLAAETQRVVHALTGSYPPQGWDHQLRNEPVLNIMYEHRRRYTLAYSADGWGADAIPLLGGMLGNFLIQAQADTLLRFGYNLPNDFGTSRARDLGTLPSPQSHDGPAASRPFRAYAFAGGGANLVARNLTLDGNTFVDGPRVVKRRLFPTVEVGVSVWTRWFETAFTYVFWGREYETQPEASNFGAATVAFRF